MNEKRNRKSTKGVNKQTQRTYNAFYHDNDGNLIRIPKNSLTWILQGEEDLYKRREGRKKHFNILESFKRLEEWFNNKFGWFFKNGNK